MTATNTLLAGAASTVSDHLNRLARWGVYFDNRRRAGQSLLEMAREHLLSALGVHFSGDIAPEFLEDLIDAVLLRARSGEAVRYDPAEHAPWRPDGRVTQEVPEPRREAIEALVESLGGSLLEQYVQTLDRHWQHTGDDVEEVALYRARVDAMLKAHEVRLRALFAKASAPGSVADLREALRQEQGRWYRDPGLVALATEAEKTAIQAVLHKVTPEWYRALETADVEALKQQLLAWLRAQQQADLQYGEARSLRDHAEARAREALQSVLGRRLLPDLITVRRGALGSTEAIQERLSLTELVMLGLWQETPQMTLLTVEMPATGVQPPSIDELRQVLHSLDVRASYLPALRERHAGDELHHALVDACEAGLRYSALKGRMASHLQEASYQRIAALWTGRASEVKVSTVQLFDRTCSQLLVFYLETSAGGVDGLVLHAPDKPDGQEWIELASLRALNAEIGRWFALPEGRHYVLQQLPVQVRDTASKEMLRIVNKPTAWPLDLDRRSQSPGYRACLAQAVRLRLQVREDEVEATESPGWYSALSATERSLLCAAHASARNAEQAFASSLEGYQSFRDYARSSVREAIGPYLLEKGIAEEVDPETILVDYQQGLGDTQSLTVNLVDLVCYGYDDNSGIDHPAKGVRSAVGQDLSALRSADLALYARGAYLGQKYVESIRARYLDASVSEQAQRRVLFGQALVAGMTRDLREALARGHIDNATHDRLRGLVSALERSQGVASSSEAVAAHDGIFRLTLDDNHVLGGYVFRYLDDGVAHDWLYTPDSNDGTLLRKYAALDAAAAGSLNGYLLDRTGNTVQAKVDDFLRRLGKAEAHRDALRHFRQVVSLAAEFEAFIEHGLADVLASTRTRGQVIRAQIIKGVMFSAPVFCVLPPFALVFGAYLVVAPLRRAIIAHTRGDTAGALQAWMDASWSVLGLALTVPGVASNIVAPLIGRARQLLVARQLPRTGELAPDAMRLSKHWAVGKKPVNLERADGPGVWEGTWKGIDRSTDPGNSVVEHFVRRGGRYFKVSYDAEAGTLRLWRAGTPATAYRPPLRLTADGKILANSVGLRGGAPGKDAGTITRVRQIANDELVINRGAFQGEAVVAGFQQGGSVNYLFTLNAQTCVAVSLYNPVNKMGAVIHFDHNIEVLIRQVVGRVLEKIRPSGTGRIDAVMAGGDWLGGADIGGPVRSVLRQNGVQAHWNHWSFSSWFGNTYGMTLNLRTGVTRVYKTPGELVGKIYEPVLEQASRTGSIFSQRAQRVLDRVRSKPNYQGASGVVRDGAGREVSADDFQKHAFELVEFLF